MAFTSTMLLQACHTIADNYPLTTQDDGVRLNIEVVIPAGEQTTRSSGHTTVAGNSAESYIDIDENDYCIMLFRDGMLWQFFRPDTFVMQGSETNSDIDRKYLLSGIVYGIEDDEDEVQAIVLANWKGYDPTVSYDFWIGQELEGNDSALYRNTKDYNFTLPDTKKCWYPDFTTTPHRTIPMFGCSDVTLSRTSADSGNTITGNTIPMLRSVAKIEVADATSADNKVEITNVSLTTFNTKGRFIPDVSTDSENAGWSDTTNGIFNQVSTPSIPDDTALNTTDTLTFFASDSSNKHFAAYVPEMKITTDANPAIAITVRSTEDHEDVKTYIIKMLDNAYNISIDKLLRNHIYRITVEKVNTPLSKNNLTLTVDVVPYNEKWLEPEFGLPNNDDDDDPKGDVDIDP